MRVAVEELQVAEEELQQQNEVLVAAQSTIDTERQRYQDLFEFAPDAYIVSDLYGVVREANRAATALLNISHHYLINKPLVNFVADSHRSGFRAVLSQLTTIHRIQEWELPMCGRKSEPFEAAITVQAVCDRHGKSISLRWLIRDITTRKQTEAKLQETQLQNLELVEADRLKDQFMATISHELRTPMTAILGFSQLLQKRIEPLEDPQIESMVERIVRNSKHLLSLIEELLDFSKLKARRLELNPLTFSLNQLAIETVHELQSLSDQKGLALQIDCDNPNVSLFNDPVRVRQVIINLLSNAIKFTDEGQVTLGFWELPEGRIMIAVQDTGMGIDLKDQENIFQEFWQIHQGSTRKNQGTGLGLAIVRALVELMQGSITIDSQVGQGTTFRIELPRNVRV
ncbi:response regulator receiver signal transduction histidine kinase [Leptolyngbya sp. NIES-2104]|nr:response regulator receiver signal transduction histidine kinase [Leptolyngbya sp. NIES-2104]